MTKKLRQLVHKKYNGHCAYCGKKIEMSEMQVDHIEPQRPYNGQGGTDEINNLNPSCRRCNHYKRAHHLEEYRKMIRTIHERTQDIYICKVAEDYGVIKIEPWDGKFYFEKVGEVNGRDR